MKSQYTIKRHLRKLRKFINDSKTSALEARIAYVMEYAVRWATEDSLVDWPSLVDEAKTNAIILNKELRDEVRMQDVNDATKLLLIIALEFQNALAVERVILNFWH